MYHYWLFRFGFCLTSCSVESSCCITVYSLFLFCFCLTSCCAVVLFVPFYYWLFLFCLCLASCRVVWAFCVTLLTLCSVDFSCRITVLCISIVSVWPLLVYTMFLLYHCLFLFRFSLTSCNFDNTVPPFVLFYCLLNLLFHLDLT